MARCSGFSRGKGCWLKRGPGSRGVPTATQRRSGDPNPQCSSKSTAIQMGGALQYKWEAYCRFPFLQSLAATKVRRYKWGAYCCTNWRCIAVLFRQSCRGWGFRNIAQPHPHSPRKPWAAPAGTTTGCKHFFGNYLNSCKALHYRMNSRWEWFDPVMSNPLRNEVSL